MVAGAFAFMPIENASTVHDIVMANTLRIDTLTATDTGAGTDLVITCPEESDACRILEVYFEENSADTIVLGALNAVINGDTYVIQADLGTTIDSEREAVAGLSGTTFGGGDTLTVVITGDSDDYNAVIFIEVEGNTEAEAVFE